MNLKLEIRRNADGVIAIDVWKNWDYNTFWWEEGNAACDCNRHLFFERAQGREPYDKGDYDAECSSGLYSVRLTDNDTGEILYDELTEKS